MAARREITKRYAREYQRASKKQRGVLLDGLCQATGWSRDTARRAIRNAFVRRGGAWRVVRKARGRKYSYDAVKILIEVWTLIARTVRGILCRDHGGLPDPVAPARRAEASRQPAQR